VGKKKQVCLFTRDNRLTMRGGGGNQASGGQVRCTSGKNDYAVQITRRVGRDHLEKGKDNAGAQKRARTGIKTN